MPIQLPEYQFHAAPVPSEPPDTSKVTELPAQTGFGVADAPVGFVDDELTVTVTLAHPVVLHVPSALT